MRGLACLLTLLPALALAQSPNVFRWTDGDGTVHYGDRVDAGVPDARVARLHLSTDPGPIARLRIDATADGQSAWIENLLAGPIEVMLHADGGGAVASDPALPARATVPAQSAVLIARIAAGNPRLRAVAIPGTPNARPRDAEYAYPLHGAPMRIQQAWNGGYSHRDVENRHAVDFAAPQGTPVLAARDGTVMQAEAGFEEGGDADAHDAVARANFVRILHDDGTMALYAHLQPGGVLARVGQRVRRGQVIGLSGNTGLSTAPHLHFVVQANRGMHLASQPFRMFGPGGALRFSESAPADAEETQ